MVPAAQSSVKPFKEMDLGRTLERIIALAVRPHIAMLCTAVCCVLWGSSDENNDGLQNTIMLTNVVSDGPYNFSVHLNIKSVHISSTHVVKRFLFKL